MLGEFMPLVVLAIIAGVIGAGFGVISWVFGPKKRTPYKMSPYECGVEPLTGARERFPVKFYLVGILFVLFDVEVVFLWTWLTVFRKAELPFQLFSGAIVGVYLLLWIIGDVYAMRSHALDWDESTSLREQPENPDIEPAVLEVVGGRS